MKTKILSFFFISVFQQYHRTKIWISSHQKCSFELENNILALNMIDITVMSSPMVVTDPKPKCRCQFALSSLSQMPCDCMPRVCLLRMMMELECLLALFWHFDAQIKTYFKLENFTLEFLCKWIINWANTINKYASLFVGWLWAGYYGAQC